MNLLTNDIKGPVSVAGVRPDLSVANKAGRIEHLLAKIVAIEFLAITGTSSVTCLLYFQIALLQWPPALESVGGSILIAMLVLLPALCFKQYNAIQAQSRDRYMWSGLGAVVLGFSLFLSVLFVVKIADWYSRGTFICQFLGVSVAMLVARGSIHSYIRRALRSGSIAARRAVLIGETKGNDEILKGLELFGIRWAGVLRLPSVHGHVVPGIQALSTNIRSFVDRCRALKPDDVIFLAEITDLPRIALLVDALSELPVTAHVIPTGVHELWGSAQIVNFSGTATIQVLRPPLSAFDLAVKRGVDICVAGLSLFVFSPLLLVVSLAIKFSSRGPIFFQQNRHGYNNEVIPVIKFRTMNISEDGETPQTFRQAKANDPRVTPLGRILRKLNIDELPQLFNVLRGEMSIVGPRPHPIALNAMYKERIAPFSRRHNVKPGLTGWAQVNGFRGETDTIEKMERRIECDLYYIDNWSFMLDLKIIMTTLFSKNAYQNAV